MPQVLGQEVGPTGYGLMGKRPPGKLELELELQAKGIGLPHVY